MSDNFPTRKPNSSEGKKKAMEVGVIQPEEEEHPG